jgi:hypothetical protein
MTLNSRNEISEFRVSFFRYYGPIPIFAALVKGHRAPEQEGEVDEWLKSVVC